MMDTSTPQPIQPDQPESPIVIQLKMKQMLGASIGARPLCTPRMRAGTGCKAVTMFITLATS